MRKIFLLITAVLCTACVPPGVLVRNGCVGSWFTIKDGRGTLLKSRMVYGESDMIPLYEFNNQSWLFVEAFSLRDNHPLGAVTQSFSVYLNSGTANFPQFDPWNVTWVQSSSANGGCGR